MMTSRSAVSIDRRYLQSGYLLLPVAVAIALIGVIAFFGANQSAVEVSAAASELEAARADYVARAGLQHGLREAARQGCGPYSDLTSVAFGSDQYGTSLTTSLGSTTSYTASVDQDTWIRDDLPNNNYAADTALHIRNEGGVVERPLLRYDLSSIPAQATILSAKAWFYVDKQFGESPVDIHLVTTDWTEANASWDSMGGSIGSTKISSVPEQPLAGVWVAANLTPQVQAWLNGQTNYGITLNAPADGIYGHVNSRESSFAPWLEVIVGTPPIPSAQLKSVGALGNGVTRTVVRRDVMLRQQPPLARFVQLGPDQVEDAWITGSKTGWNYGGNTLFNVNEGGGPQRGLIHFDLDGVLPHEAILTSARLELFAPGAGGIGQVRLYGLKKDWVEGSCSGACSGAVTWDTTDGVTPWSTPGGDADSLPVAEAQAGNSNIWYGWDISAIARQWVAGTRANHGLLIRGEGADMVFNSSDHSDSSTHPRITLGYTCPCGQVCSTPQGSGRIALIGDDNTPDPDDQLKIGIIESWGYDVDFYQDRDSGTINWSNYDLAYISETAVSGDVDNGLVNLPVGIVNEEPLLYPDLAQAYNYGQKVGSAIDITDNGHYITAPFALGTVPIYVGDMEIITTPYPLPAGARALAEFGGDGAITVLDRGATNSWGNASPGRRVTLPLGRHLAENFNWKQLNSNGLLLVQRAIEWGMEKDKVTLGNLLLIVVNPGNLTTQENAKKALFESWGYAVNPIDESDSQANFDTALAANDVVYITEDVSAGNVGTKLVNATIGVVTEEANLSDEFGFSDGIHWGSGTDLKMERNHYITYTLPVTASTILTVSESLADLTGAQAPDIQLIGYNGFGPSLATLETGASLIQGRIAAGRRVFLPWGGNAMNINHLNDDGRTILRRSLEWAAGADLDLGPLAHWKLDETSGTIAVDSRGGHDGTLTSGPLWASGMLNGGLALGGFNDAIVVPHDASLSLNNALTFTAWVYSKGFGAYDLVLGKGNTATDFAYFFGAEGDEITFGFEDTAYHTFSTTDLNLQTDTWHHIAATFDNATDRILLYHNGVKVYTGSTTLDLPVNSNDLYIGNSENGAAWNGTLDDVQIYDRVLDATEIAALAERPGPLAHWKFDDGSGNTAIDSVGGHDATIINPVWDPGQDGGAIRVQALDQAGAAPHDSNLTLTRGLTLMAWVSKDSLNGYDTAIDKASSGSDINYYLGTWYDEIVFGFSTSSDSWQGYYTSGVGLSTGAWDHIAATFDNIYDEVRIYRNGGLVQTFPASLEPLTNSGNLWLGRSALNTEVLSGRLDDARIYDRVLDADEIRQVYDNTAGGGGGGSGYTEANQTWLATTDNAWQTFDLSGFGVPANAVVEIVIENTKTGSEREGGVRAVGSTVGRKFDLQEAEGGGVDALSLHVQADASSQIQHFAEKRSDIRFRMVGYWTGASHTDLDQLFSAGASNSWRTHNLSSYGVAPGQIVEIIAQNNNSGNEYLAGVRASGSSNTETFDLHEAESGGHDFLSIFVEASNDASASIEVYAENDGEVEFKVVGAWDTPPGTYTEARAVLGNPTADSSWQTFDLSGFGVPTNSVAQIVMSNRFASAQNRQGVRSVGSGLARYVDIHEPESGGEDLVTIHVPVDGSSQIQWMHQDVSDAHRFYLAGWWVLSP